MNEAEVMRICGENGIRGMAAAFYRRVKTDDLLGPMYPENDLAGAEERLAEFLLFRLGASTRYLETRGHPRLRMRHIPFKIDIAERDRWLELMSAAMDEARIPATARGFLDPFFAQVADFMRNQPDRAPHPRGA
jgi:hemoglobin